MTYNRYVGDEEHKQRTLKTKVVLDFISKHPEGVTAEDFYDAGVFYQDGITRLIQLKQVVGIQVREPERGPRAYHWLWKINRQESNNE